jgi:nicotinamide-nucleotide amidase
MALQFGDAVRQLGRSARHRDVRVRPTAVRVPDLRVRYPRQEREDQTRVRQGSEIPRAGAPHGRARSVLPAERLHPLGDTLGIVPSGPHPCLTDPEQEVSELGQSGGIRAEPSLESGLDAIEVRERRSRDVVSTPVGQDPVVRERIEELARPSDEIEQAVDLPESCRSTVSHVLPPFGSRHPSRSLAIRQMDRRHAGMRRWYGRRPAAACQRRSGGVTLPCMDGSEDARRLLVAELLAIGSELTVGDTRDTNGGELARDLTQRGVRVGRISALPDDLATVMSAISAALGRADLVVMTGGLGPTPDDLTREAIAAVWGETPVVDPTFEAWLRDRFERRGVPFPLTNLKQAWTIPSATILPNPNGTAPGWYVTDPEGRIVVALPGPPREMRPMWQDHVLPLLEARGLGRPTATRTYRLTAIGESHVADILGDILTPGRNPEVATYARAEAVDVRISAVDDPANEERSAADVLAETARRVEALLGAHIWATGDATWPDAIGMRLEAAGWSVALVESGTGGAIATLFGDVPWLRYAERRSEELDPTERDGDEATILERLAAAAAEVRERTGTEAALAVTTRPHGEDTAVFIVAMTPRGTTRERRIAFLSGAMGRSRAALAAAAALWSALAPDDRPRV